MQTPCMSSRPLALRQSRITQNYTVVFRDCKIVVTTQSVSAREGILYLFY